MLGAVDGSRLVADGDIFGTTLGVCDGEFVGIALGVFGRRVPVGVLDDTLFWLNSKGYEISSQET
jgi:hypothetical protein